MAVDITALWSFKDPAASELRFRQALATSTGDDRIILQTQIARTHGMRKQFELARQVLRELEPQLVTAGPEANARFWLEWGRTWASASHPKASSNHHDIIQARDAFERSLGLAKTARMDSLAIDAIHMLAFVDTDPPSQLKWAQLALDISLSSTQVAARAWEASIRNNLGMALTGLSRLPEALAQFEQALTLRRAAGKAGDVVVARWMVAWTLRLLNRVDEALGIQLDLEAIGESSKSPDPHVMDELAELYAALANDTRAAAYRARAKQLRGH